MGCISSQTFEVEEEIVFPEDYNNDPVLILSGRRQAAAPTQIHLHRIKRVSSSDAETHNREILMHLSDPVVVQGHATKRRLSMLVRQHTEEAASPASEQKSISIYRRQSSVEVRMVTPPGSPTRRVSLFRRHSTHEVRTSLA